MVNIRQWVKLRLHWVESMYFPLLQQQMSVKLCFVCNYVHFPVMFDSRCSGVNVMTILHVKPSLCTCKQCAHANNNHHINLLHWTQHLLKYRTKRRAINVSIPDREKLETGCRDKLRLKGGKNIKSKSSRNGRYSHVSGSSTLWVGWDGSDCSAELHQPGFLECEASAFARTVSIIRVDGVLPPSQNHSLPVCRTPPTTHTRIQRSQSLMIPDKRRSMFVRSSHEHSVFAVFNRLDFGNMNSSGCICLVQDRKSKPANTHSAHNLIPYMLALTTLL